jgi:hypothetical protein
MNNISAILMIGQIATAMLIVPIFQKAMIEPVATKGGTKRAARSVNTRTGIGSKKMCITILESEKLGSTEQNMYLG